MAKHDTPDHTQRAYRYLHLSQDELAQRDLA